MYTEPTAFKGNRSYQRLDRQKLVSRARRKALDMFCGAGGAAKGLQRAGFHVTGIDISAQPRYCGDEFHQADAVNFPLDGFDLIWASPPCQYFSTMRVMANARGHVDLLRPTRERLQAARSLYVIENVVGSPIELRQPSLFTGVTGIMLCGSMFGLNNGEHELRRHRLFESNAPLKQPSCRHRLPVIGFYGDHARSIQPTVAGIRQRGGDIDGAKNKLKLVKELMGIDWMTWREATQSIPPAYSEFIGRQIIESM